MGSEFLIRPNESAKTIEIPVRIRKGNKIEFFYSDHLPNIQEGTLARLIIPAHAVQEKDKRLLLSSEKIVELLPTNSVLFTEVTIEKWDDIHPEICQKIQATSARLEKSENTCGKQFFHGRLGFIEVILQAPLNLILRGTKQAKLKNCQCYIPLLDKTVGSLNQAYYQISQAIEVHRASHGGSVFDHMYYSDGKNCISLDDLRKTKEAEEEQERFINKQNTN